MKSALESFIESSPKSALEFSRTYSILTLKLAREVKVRGQNFSFPRSEWILEFAEDLQKASSENAFLGISEGDDLSEKPRYEIGGEAADLLLADPFLEREWGLVEIYFSKREAAEKWRIVLGDKLESLKDLSIREELSQDWNAKWKEGFTGVDVSPFWRIQPEWKKADFDLKDDLESDLKKNIWLNPAMGFGAGTHPTSQLCLQAIGGLNLGAKKILDFGTGSGILSIASLLQGACKVDAVEIDPQAIESARETARINGFEEKIQFSEKILSPSENKYDLIVANILAPVLKENVQILTSALRTQGILILAGLLHEDEAELEAIYRQFLGQTYKDISLEKERLDIWSLLLWKVS